MKKYETIRVSAKQYEDHDDCFAAAAADYAADHAEAVGYDMDPRWETDERDHILLDVPSDDDVAERESKGVDKINIYRQGGQWCYAAWAGEDFDHSDTLDADTYLEACDEIRELFPHATIRRV